MSDLQEPLNPCRAVFFDRDGVLNVDSGFVFRPENFFWRPTAVECVKWLNAQGVLVFVVTNQSGVARGLYTEADVQALHAHMQTTLAEHGAHIDAYRYCPHHPDGEIDRYRIVCACRKPGSGMIVDLLRSYRLDPEDCRLFGDRETDIAAGHEAGVPSTLVREGRSLMEIVCAALARDG